MCDAANDMPDPSIFERLDPGGAAMTLKDTVSALMRLTERSVPGVPIATAIPRVTIWSSRTPTDAKLALFEPKFYLLLQGRKRLLIGGRPFEFGAGDCAVSSVGLPFSTQVIEATQQVPYIGLELALDADLIATLIDDAPVEETPAAPTFVTAPLNEDVTDAVGRLVRLLQRPDDIPVLAGQAERELCYRLLQGPMGDTLRQTVLKGTRTARIRQAIAWIRENARDPMRIADLADAAGMSVTSFHRHFKAATASSPLAYQRYIRLLEAKRMIVSGETDVTGAAFATGYASSSQFSREYKQMFGTPPIGDRRTAHRSVRARPHLGGAAAV